MDGFATVVSPQPDPRVQVGVEHVDDDVRGHHDDGEEEDRPEDEAEVERGQDRVGEQEPDALQVEDELDDREAADEPREGEAEDGDRDVERVAPRVASDDLRLGDALRARGPDVVEVHHLEHGVAHVAQDHRDRAVGDHQRGQDQADQGVAARASTGRGRGRRPSGTRSGSSGRTSRSSSVGARRVQAIPVRPRTVEVEVRERLAVALQAPARRARQGGDAQQEERREEEPREREAGERQDPRALVERPVPVDGRVVPERDGEREDDDEREDGELERVGKEVGEHGDDRKLGIAQQGLGRVAPGVGTAPI